MQRDPWADLEAGACAPSTAAKADPSNPHVTGMAAFDRAMSLCRQGKHDEARALALVAAATMKPLLKDEQNPLANHGSHDDLILWLAYKGGGHAEVRGGPERKDEGLKDEKRHSSPLATSGGGDYEANAAAQRWARRRVYVRFSPGLCSSGLSGRRPGARSRARSALRAAVPGHAPRACGRRPCRAPCGARPLHAAGIRRSAAG
jgi:hypothetical protein